MITDLSDFEQVEFDENGLEMVPLVSEQRDFRYSISPKLGLSEQFTFNSK